MTKKSDDTKRRELCRRLGLSALPANFPLRRAAILEAIFASGQTQRRRVERKVPFAWKIASDRFGLREDWTYKTLEATGKKHGLHREKVRQFEVKVKRMLGVPSEI